MRYCSNPTENEALGHISREWKQMVKIARKIRQDPYSDWSFNQSKRFTGIFKRLLTDPLPEEEAS